MFKGIHMPPGTIVGESVEGCMTYGETLTISFDETGFFGSSPAGVFTPDLPMGLFFAGQTIGPFAAPNTDKVVTIGFFDLGQHAGFYLEILKIRSECPS